MRFQYRATTQEGRIAHGQLEAINLTELEQRLQHMGLELISSQVRSSRMLIPGRRLARRDLIHFCFHLDHLVRAGVPLLDSLNDLYASLETGHLRETIGRLITRIENGAPLSQAMRESPDAFTPIMVNLVRAGESSGRLPEVFSELTESLKWEDELATHTRKLLLYPMLVATLVFAATAFLMIHLVPQLKTFILNMGQALPLHSRLLFKLSDFMLAHWSLLLCGPPCILLGAGLLLHFKPSARRRLDTMKLSLPLIGPILKKIILARLAGTLAMLYASGMPVIDALAAIRELAGNQAITEALQNVEKEIQGGAQLAPAFLAAGLFPALIIRMLRVGESTGHLDKALLNVAYFYNRDVREAIGHAQSMIEPTLTIVLGLLLGWIMLAVIGPIYDVIGRIAT